MNRPSDMTVEEVKGLSMRINNAVLYQCIAAYETGSMTWGQAMQAAAVILAESYGDLIRKT